MPRKQRFKPSRKPKPLNEEIGSSASPPQTRVASSDRTDGVPSRERQEHGPDASEVNPSGEAARVSGVHSERQG